MPRNREFDPDEALHRAMLLFWRKGYSSTSIDDLVRETGVSRYGLYSVFNNKHGLFLAALDNYEQTAIATRLQEIEHPDASLENIRRFFSRIVESARRSETSFGCFLCNTASELPLYEKEEATIVERYFTRMTHAFQHALENAQSQGTLPASVEVETHAKYLTGLVMGLSVYTQTSIDRAALESFVQVGLSWMD